MCPIPQCNYPITRLPDYQTSFEEQFPSDPRHHVLDAGAGLQIREHERPLASHQLRIARHHAEARSHVIGQIDLVDDQQVGSGDARTALPRNLVTGGDVDDVDRRLHQFRAEARGEIVAAALEKDEVEIGEPTGQLVQRVKVHRGILADRRVRTSTRLHADDAIRGERLAPYQEFHVLAGEDIVGDYAELVVGTHALAERVDERGLAGANRTADADSNRSG